MATSGTTAFNPSIDEIIEEPLGGAHRDIHTTCENVRATLITALEKFKSQTIDDLLTARYQRLTQFGVYKGSI